MPHASRRPDPRTRFIGRRRVLAELLALAAGERLVTVVGVGGAGKTRTTLALLDAAGPEFGAIDWVELAPVEEPALVATAVCAALGIRPAPGMPPAEAAARSLGDGPRTLVLDNCEHVLEGAAALAHELLLRCPDLRILATSREPLEIPGEVVWPLPPLTVPSEGTTDVAEALASEAVRLFVDRIGRVRPGFEPGPETVSSLVTICRRLDGIPLALELAAARTRALGLAAIAERLDAVLPLLQGRNREAPERHRTMTAAIEWSHSMLEPDERALFRRMGAFGGSADLDACEAICAGPPLAEGEVLDVLTRLVDRSLVVPDERSGEPRYRLLEPIAQYASARLAGSDEEAEVHARHTDWYLTLVEETAPDLRSGEREVARARLLAELDNLRRAWDRAVARGRDEVLGRLSLHLFWLWNFAGLFAEGRRRVEAALEVAEPDSPALPPILWAAGTLTWMTGDLELAEKRLRRCVAASSASDDRMLLGTGLRELGGVLFSKGAVEEADEAYGRALEHLPAEATPWDRALAGVTGGFVRRMLGREEEGDAMVAEGRALFARVADPWGLALAEHMLGVAAGRNGDPESALAHGEVALRMQRADGDLWNVAQVLLLVGEAELHLDRVRDAGRRIREALVASHHMGDLITLSHGADLLARAAARLGNPALGLRLAGAAQSCRDRLGGVHYPYSLDLEGPGTWLEETRGAMDPGEAARAWADGIAMDPDEIAGIALEGREAGVGSGGGPFGSGPVPELRIRALGAPEIVRGERVLRPEDWGYALPRELLFNLLIRGPRTKERIGLDFWPDADADQLRGRFRTALYQLRQALGGNEWVTYRDGRYAFGEEGRHWFDVAAFEDALAAARETVQTDPDSAAEELARAVELYRGDFLDGEDPGEWADPVRSRLRRGFLEALVTLGRIRRTQGALDRAEALLSTAVEEEPLAEAAHLELARVLMARGARSKAIELLTDHCGHLEEELGAAPGPAIADLLSELRGEG